MPPAKFCRTGIRPIEGGLLSHTVLLRIGFTFAQSRQCAGELLPRLSILRRKHPISLDSIIKMCIRDRLDDEIRRRYKGRILVVQPSLMPAFYEDGLCGVDIQKAALEYGIKVAGVTVYILGDSDSRNKIVLQKPGAVRRDETPESLDYRIRVAYGEETLPKAIDMIGGAELKKIRAYQIEKKYVN